MDADKMKRSEAMLRLKPSLAAALMPAAMLLAAAAPPQGTTADTSAGRVGQRQERDRSPVNVAPMERISSRVATRVESRIQNRIDRNYVGQSGVADAITTAGNRARTAGQGRRR
jgi:hypothetical protein